MIAGKTLVVLFDKCKGFLADWDLPMDLGKGKMGRVNKIPPGLLLVFYRCILQFPIFVHIC
jgi:hypothetical protein